MRMKLKSGSSVTLALILCLALSAGCRKPKTWTLQPRAVPPPPELGSGQDNSQDFNVVWSKTDPDQSPQNPDWGSQTRVGKLPPTAACTGDLYKCTGQNPVMDQPKGLSGAFCAVAAGFPSFYGHADWGVAEYHGAIGWLNFNVWDGDFDWVLKSDNLEGVTENNFPQSPKKDPQFLELEFDSRETAPHFGDAPAAKWWPELYTKALDGALSANFDDVDNYLHPGNPAKKNLACGVVTGVFGLDCDHGCRSEVHPVYSMALQTNEDPQHNEWVVLVRNWGGGGFCSGWNDELTASQMAVVLPVAASSGPTNITVEQFAGTGVACPTTGYVSGEGEKLLFNLPPPEQSGMAVMVVKMTWPSGTPTMQCTNVDVNDLRRWRSDVVSGVQDIDAEGKLSRAMRDVGMVPKASPASRSTRDVIQPYIDARPLKPKDKALLQVGTTAAAIVCPPVAERALEMKLAQKPAEYAPKKLPQNAAAAVRNRQLFAAVCSAYASQNKPLPDELQKVCSNKSVKGK
jgi:hypothetical protein